MSMTPPRREEGISEAIGFILILAAIIIALSLYLLYILPSMGREDEIATMKEIKERLTEYKVDIDTLWTSRQCSTAYGPALSIGGGKSGGILSFVPFLQSQKASPSIALNHRNEYITISSDSYFSEPGVGYNETLVLATSPTTITMNAPPRQVYIILSPNDLTLEKGVYIQGPTWSAWVNITPLYVNVSRFDMTTSSGRVTGYSSWYDSLRAGTDITVTTFKGQTPRVYSLAVYQNVSTSSVYPVDLMNPAYGISAELQNAQTLQAWTSNATLNASYRGDYGYSSRVSSDTRPMGSLEFMSNNYHYVPQTYYYQLGGVFLEQQDGATMVVPPSIGISYVNGSTAVRIGRIQLLGSLLASTMVGTGPITMVTAVTDIKNTPLAPGANTRWVNLSIQAADTATAQMWNRTFLQIANQGSLPPSLYTLGTAGNVAFMNITGNPQLYDIQLSLTHVNVSGDYIDDYPAGGITRSWRSLQGYRALPPPVTWTTPPVTTFSPPIPPSLPASGASPPWTCGWYNRRNVTINGSAVTGSLSNFPVLLNITNDAGLMNSARSDGWDIYFTDISGTTQIPYEREYFNKASGDLIAWVKVPSLTSGQNTTIYMYYNRSVSSDQQSPASVWDSNYLAVWHLGETVTDESTSGTHYDSKGTYNGVQHNNGPIAGKIAGAQYFDGSGDYITVDTHPALTTQITMETWVNLTSPGNDQKIVGDLHRVSDYEWYGYILGVQNSKLYPEIYDTTGTQYTFEQGSFPANTWTFLVMNWTTGGRLGGFVNGTAQTGTAAGSNNIGDYTGTLRIGMATWDQYPVTGRIDEVRISNIVRSPDWIKTEYTNQDKPHLFAYLMPEETTPVCPVLLQSKTASSRNVNSLALTLDSPLGPGNLSIVSFVVEPMNVSVASVTDPAGFYHLARGPDPISTWGNLYTYYATDHTGANTITIQFGGTASLVDAFAAEFSRIALANPLDQTSAGTGTTTAINSGTRATTQERELIYGFAGTESSASPNSPNTLIASLDGHFTAYQIGPAPYFYNISGTNSAGSWTCQMATFRSV